MEEMLTWMIVVGALAPFIWAFVDERYKELYAWRFFQIGTVVALSFLLDDGAEIRACALAYLTVVEAVGCVALLGQLQDAFSAWQYRRRFSLDEE